MSRPFIPELLDAASGPSPEVAGSLADLQRFNRWLGGRQVWLSLLEGEVQRARLETFSLLDVGAGSGDLAFAVTTRFPLARVVLADLKPYHLPIRRQPSVAAAAQALPFPDASFDFVGSSLLLHQLQDREAIEVLSGFGRVARRAVLISDLERHWFPLLFLRLTKPVFAHSPVTRHDAPASIRQAFRPEELAALALAAGFGDISVRRHRPWFRLSLVARTCLGHA
jgi:ubiquinone/menaquinone biosynthesis C-methylase UbiE